MKKQWLAFLLLPLLFFACGEPAPPEATSGQREKSFFHTTDPSRLYFKNIRSTYYEMTEQPQTRAEVYRLRKFDDDNSRPIFYPIIVNHWMRDEAYLLIQPNDYEGGFPDTLAVIWRGVDSTGVYRMEPGGFPQQYQFAAELAAGLRAGHELRMINRQNDTVDLFRDFDDRTNFLITLRDFEKLIEQR